MAVAVHSDSAGAATDETSQEPLVGSGAAGTPPAVVTADVLGSGKDVVGDDGCALDRDPFGAVAADLAVVAPGPRVGNRFGLVPVDGPDVGLVGEQPADGGGAPHGFAGRGGDGVGVEPAGDLTDRVAAGDVVVEDAPHNDGFWFVDHEMRGTLRAAGDAPVPVWRSPGEDLARSGSPQPA